MTAKLHDHREALAATVEAKNHGQEANGKIDNSRKRESSVGEIY